MRAVVLVTTLCVAAIALEATPSAGAMTFLPQSKGAISISSQNRARNHQGGGPNQAKAEGSFSRPSRLAKLGKARTATASAGSHANDATVQVGDAPPLEEVVVTADRRTEKIQDVPISVTALSGAELRNLSAQSFSDYAQAVPGLSFASGGPGLNRIAIRGVSSSGGSSATVGYYIDDTPISDIKYNPDLDLIDLQRIEVLRGPQGTLYGSGSMGGTIRLITNKPKLNAWSAQLTASLADTANGGLDTEEDAVLNAPIAANVAALRLAVFWRHTDGFINRVKPLADDPMVADPKSPVERAVNSFQSAGFRLGVDFQPVTDLTINPSVFYQRFTLANPQTVDVPPASGSELVQLRISPEPEFDSLTLGSLAIRYSPGAVQLISTTSLYRRHQTDVEDASRFIYFVFYPQQSYLLPTTDTEDRRTDSFTQEIRVESRTAQRFQWLVGLFYTKIKVPFGVFQPAYGFNEAFNLGIPNEVIFGENRRIDTRESAVYGQTSYSLSHGVRLIAGARISWDRQAFTDTQSGLFGSDATTAGSSAERSVNPKYEISYQPRRNLLTYVNAARGFRLGGPITPPPVPLCSGDLQAIGLSAPPTQYKADHLWSYETGAKTSWFEQRLRVNGSAYYIDWQDIQQNITLKNCGYNFTGNAGAAVSKGGELEVQTSSPSGVSTGASVSYTDAYITRAAPGTGVIPGQPVLETPRWNLTGSVGYQREIADRYEGFVFLETMYTSHDYTYFVVTDPAHRRSGYSLTNLRCGVQGDHWGAAFFVRNVFNRFAILQYPTPLTADVPYYRRASIETPRTVGVSVHVTF